MYRYRVIDNVWGKDEDGEWFKADEVVELAKRVLENIDFIHLEDCPALYGNKCFCGLDTMVAELEQIVKDGRWR